MIYPEAPTPKKYPEFYDYILKNIKAKSYRIYHESKFLLWMVTKVILKNQFVLLFFILLTCNTHDHFLKNTRVCK